MFKFSVFVFAVVTALCFPRSAAAAPGDLDPSFGSTGKVTTFIGSGDEFARGMAIQSDGKIVVVGESSNGSDNDFAVVRYNVDGSLDASFNPTGVKPGTLTTPIGSSHDDPTSVVVQSDGKIVVAGYYKNGNHADIALARYNSDGSLDDGGPSDSTPGDSFGTGGKVMTDFFGNGDYGSSVALQGDGKIVVGGYATNGNNVDFAIARYNIDGTLDTTFNSSGKVTTDIRGGNDYGNTVAVQSDGKIVLAGQAAIGGKNNFAVARYNTNGTLDTSFNSTGPLPGTVTTDIGSVEVIGSGMALQKDGKIVVAGSSNTGGNLDFAVIRYNANGMLDTSFNATGYVTTPIGIYDEQGYCVIVQSDGKIVVAGRSYNGSDYDFALVRYNADGTLDTSFNPAGLKPGTVTTPISNGIDIAYCIALQNDGKIVAAGSSVIGNNNNDFAVVRYFASDAPVAATGNPATVSNSGAMLTGTVNPAGQETEAYFG